MHNPGTAYLLQFESEFYGDRLPGSIVDMRILRPVAACSIATGLAETRYEVRNRLFVLLARDVPRGQVPGTDDWYIGNEVFSSVGELVACSGVDGPVLVAMEQEYGHLEFVDAGQVIDGIPVDSESEPGDEFADIS